MSEHGSRRAGGGGSRGGGRRSASAGGFGDKLEGLAGQLSGVFGKRRGGSDGDGGRGGRGRNDADPYGDSYDEDG
ncbi:MAG: MFS transporter, partial [Catenulispora sp.]|nr:MFS transporter [Catenulispora sp.]